MERVRPRETTFNTRGRSHGEQSLGLNERTHLHVESLSIELDLMRLHDLLDRLADVAQPDVDPRLFYTTLRRLSHCEQKRVVPRRESLRERAVYDAPVDLRAEIKFDDVVSLDDGFVAAVRGPVRGDVVPRATGRERDPCLEPALLDQRSHRDLQALAHVN